jgi:hypothetical protein
MYPIKCASKLIAVVAVFGLVGCEPGQPKGASDDLQISGFAAPLSQSEFNSLPAEKQYQVASKLYGTFFRGISAEDFFDFSNGVSNLVPKNSQFLQDVRNDLNNISQSQAIQDANTLIEGLDAEGNPDESLAKYTFDDDTDADENEKAMQIPLARIKEYPIGRELYVQWMAYFLSNTIMYSPAIEMESTDTIDAANMFSFLSSSVRDKKSIREMVRSNLPSLKRWRVSRSAENHALEAYELYLGLFETEIDSVKGGTACKDVYLTDDDSGYVVSSTGVPNTEPQLILGNYFITTCTDLYDVIAGHPLIIPRAIEVIVNYLYSGRSREDRVALIASIQNGGVETYEEIFTAILFSKEYLLNTERPRSFEESFMPLLDSLKWNPAATNGFVDERIFEFIASGTVDPRGFGGSNILYLGNKGWHSMSLKIGRLPDVPFDALSFANYHQSVREHLFLNLGSYQGSLSDRPGLIYKGEGDDADADLRDVIAQLNLTDYIHFLFLNGMQRKASAAEIDALIIVFDNASLLEDDINGNKIVRPNTSNNHHNNIAGITFDYISRLPEFYYFRAAN